MNTENNDYKQFRGKCKEFCDAAILADPTLTLVRGTYFCPVWCRDEPHWWTTRPDGSIFDPTARQFGSKGYGIYTPFDGHVECSECGKDMLEGDVASFHGNYAFCSAKCNLRFVGL